MSPTNISWTSTHHADGSVTKGETWNPITGCSKVSPACAHCYAERLSLKWGWSTQPWTPVNAAQNVVLHPDRLDEPRHWKKPRRIFVCSMADLFHEQIPWSFLDEIFTTIEETPQHVYQVLTKRPERMRDYLTERYATTALCDIPLSPGPFSNLWCGVSVENQHWADVRIPILLQTPAVVRFLSCEPLLGSLDLDRWFWEHCPSECDSISHRRNGYKERQRNLHWVIVGGESVGPANRSLVHRIPVSNTDAGGKVIPGSGRLRWYPKPDAGEWVQSLRDQCQAAGVPFHFKQWGGPTPKSGGRLLDGRTWDEFPGAVPVELGKEYPMKWRTYTQMTGRRTRVGR